MSVKAKNKRTPSPPSRSHKKQKVILLARYVSSCLCTAKHITLRIQLCLQQGNTCAKQSETRLNSSTHSKAGKTSLWEQCAVDQMNPADWSKPNSAVLCVTDIFGLYLFFFSMSQNGLFLGLVWPVWKPKRSFVGPL